MNSRIKGNIGIGKSIAYFTSQGYALSIPLTDTQPYDLIIDSKEGLKRVQVKYTGCKRDGNYHVGLRTIRCNTKKTKISLFDSTKVDIIFAVTSYGACYLIPVESLDVKTGISLGKKYEKWKVSQ